MTLPVTSFFNLPAGNQPLSLLDQQFNAVAVTGVLPCAATGTNAVVLTPGANVYVPTSYTTGLKVVWVQPLSTGPGSVTINVAGLGAVTAFKANGSTPLGISDLVGGLVYTATYSAALSSGSGGFSVDVVGGGGTAGVIVSDTAPASPVSGQLWWDSTGALLYMWYVDPTSAQWVNVNNYGPGTTGSGPPAPVSAAVQGTFKHLQVSVPSATTVTITADALTVYDGTAYTTLLNVNSTITSTTSGANGLDTGALAQATWYAVWVISGTVGTAGMLSLSATTPTMPSGYTARARVGWVITAPTTTNIVKTLQYGRRAQYIVTGTAPNTSLPLIAQGPLGTYASNTPVYAAASVSGVVPPTASIINMVASSPYKAGAYSGIQVAPNNSYVGTNNAAGNGPFYESELTAGPGITVPISMMLESTNIYVAIANAGGGVQCAGYEDNI